MPSRWWMAGALGLVGLVSAGVGAEERPLPTETRPVEQAVEKEAAAESAAAPEADTVAGPTPGAPTLTLAGSLAEALEQNPGLRTSADQVAGAQIREAAAKAQFYPKLTPGFQRGLADASSLQSPQQLTLDASQKVPWTGASVSAFAARRFFPAGSTIGGSTSDMRFTLSQPLLRGFGPVAGRADFITSRRQREAQERRFELDRQRLAVDVASAFYQVVRQRQLGEVSRQSLDRTTRLREASEARMKVGLASKLDVFRAELQAAQAREAMVSAEAALDSALEQFRVLIGRAPTDAVEPAEVRLDDVLAVTLEPVEALVQKALANRVDLREDRDEVKDGRRSAFLARQNLLPQLDLNVGYSRFGAATVLDGIANSIYPGTSRWNVYFTTSYPLDRSSALASKAVADLDLAARDRQLQQDERQVETEVRAAVRNLERIRKSVELQRQNVQFAAQQHRLATLRYHRGLGSNFDVVEAEGSLVAARTALVGLLTDFEVARAQLLRATGADVLQELQR